MGHSMGRGELVRSYRTIQKDCSYKIGYRTKKPSLHTVARICEELTKERRITLRKERSGQVISICNYDELQLQPNHERNDERNDRGTVGEQNNNVNNIYYTAKKKKLTGKRLETFERFWCAFGYKKGKAEAADSWLNIPVLTDTVVEKIVWAAEAEAKRRPEMIQNGRTPKMAQGWLTARRWEDEEYTKPEKKKIYQ